jgi:hypothetical protein
MAGNESLLDSRDLSCLPEKLSKAGHEIPERMDVASHRNRTKILFCTTKQRSCHPSILERHVGDRSRFSLSGTMSCSTTDSSQPRTRPDERDTVSVGMQLTEHDIVPLIILRYHISTSTSVCEAAARSLEQRSPYSWFRAGALAPKRNPAL